MTAADGLRPVLLESVRYRYPGAGEDAVRGISLAVAPGEHLAVLGPNGAGKSTLLRLVIGTVRPLDGQALLWGRPPAAWGRREVARRVGVVAQGRPPDFPLPVREFVELGRNPHLRPWQRLGAPDRAAVDEALARTDLAELQGRRIGELSGGELQRAKLARALAQQPRLLILDEPTAHLDLGHELSFFELVEELRSSVGLTVVTVTHNLNLASRYAANALLLADGRRVIAGAVADVLDVAPLQEAFGCALRVLDLGALGRQVIPGSLPGGASGAVAPSRRARRSEVPRMG